MPDPRRSVATATATVVLLAALVALPAGGLIARAHATADPTKARHEHPSTITISGQRRARSVPGPDDHHGADDRRAQDRSDHHNPWGSETPNAALGTPNTTPHTAPIEDLDDYIAGIIATIPAQWRVEGWSYTIVDATPNGAMGDTWGPDGTTAPYSQYSRSLMTPLMSSPGGQSAIEMVVLHEAMNAKAYSVVDANDWSSVAGWPPPSRHRSPSSRATTTSTRRPTASNSVRSDSPSARHLGTPNPTSSSVATEPGQLAHRPDRRCRLTPLEIRRPR